MIFPAVGRRSGAFRDVLIDGFVPPPSSVAPMFPFYDNSPDWDDFGEVINPDDYVIKDVDMDRSLMPVSIHSEFLIVEFLSFLNFFLARMVFFM